MNEDEIRKRVIARYAVEYPDWQDIRVTEIVVSSLSGYLAVVRANEKGVSTEGEICHVSEQGKVIPFSTTEELARHLGRQLDQTWYDKLFSKSGVAAIVTVVLLITLCILSFKKDEVNQQVIQILGGAFVAAVGFFFGSATNRTP
jgi:hypothetical protein